MPHATLPLLPESTVPAPLPLPPLSPPPSPASPKRDRGFAERHDDPAQAEELERQQDA